MISKRTKFFNHFRKRDAVYENSSGICYFCNKLIDGKFEMHDVIPKFQGGKRTVTNLKPVHPECHTEFHREVNIALHIAAKTAVERGHLDKGSRVMCNSRKI